MNEFLRECKCCNKSVSREDMLFTTDCYGIAYRLVCSDCYDKLMKRGYDGVYYTSLDECIDDDY